MARKPRTYEDDDGRTVADMSGVEGPHLFLPRFRREGGGGDPSPRPTEGREGPSVPHRGEDAFSPEERRMYALGALKAALLIALAFLAGFALLIGLLVLAGKLKLG